MLLDAAASRLWKQSSRYMVTTRIGSFGFGEILDILTSVAPPIREKGFTRYAEGFGLPEIFCCNQGARREWSPIPSLKPSHRTLVS